MGWRGAIRSITAASNRYAREVERQTRQLEREQFRLNKLQAEYDAITGAKYEVDEFNDLIQSLVGIGRECGEYIHWPGEFGSPEPIPPEPLPINESIATAELNNYKPSLSEQLFSSPEKKKHDLKKAILAAKELDHSDYIAAHSQYTKEWTEWKEKRDLAKRVLSGELEVYGEILQELSPFNSLADVGSAFTFDFHGTSVCCVEIEVTDESIVPILSKSLTSTGKLSSRPMPESKRLEIYQDYVCGVLFRAARELFSVLPLQFVISSSFRQQINLSTGLPERVCIASLAARPETLNGLNFQRVDFSEAMKVFRNRMSFSKMSGFEAVNPLLVEDFDLTDIG